MRVVEAIGGRSAKGWRGAAALLALGAAAALGHAPASWPLAALAGFGAVGFLLVHCPDRAAAIRIGWLFGTGYFAVSLVWIVEPFLVRPERDGWMAPFALALSAAGFGLFWGLAFGLARMLGSGSGSRAVALAAALTGVGMLREELLTGFPWALPSYVWAETPVAQALAYIGPHGLTFLTLLAAFSPLLWRRRWAAAAVALAAVASAWGLGLARLADADAAGNVRVRLVQPNVPQPEKWNPDRGEEFFQRLLALTRAPATEPIDLVVWPETAITALLRDARGRFPEIADAAGAARVVTGVRRRDEGRYYNSMIVLDQSGVQAGQYDKHHLVPFGEYVPLAPVLSGLGLSGLASQVGFSAGPGPQILDVGPEAGRLLPLICYEAIFPRETRTAERPDGMLQITNDGWFGSFSGPQQHFAQARLRAIELGLPLLRSANTGISAVVDAKGRIVAALPLGEEGVLDAAIPTAGPPTPYLTLGDAPTGAALAAAALLLLWRRRRNLR